MTKVICAAVICALALAACDSSNQPKSAAGGRGQALKFADCMRAHGVPNFPDPSAGGAIDITPQSGINPQSPSFQAAQHACSRYAPLKGHLPKMSASERRKALRFAECMRAHGEPDFPDPTLTTPKGATAVLVLRGMVFAFGPGAQLDPKSPAFKQAATACGVKPP